MKPTTSPYILVKKSSIHNLGVFAKTDIPKDTPIIEYVGKKISKKESDRIASQVLTAYKKDAKNNGGVYIFNLNSRFDIDGNVPYNTARLINHACTTNCEAIDDDGHIWIIATRNIKKGEELFYNYGYDIANFQDHPCYCGAKNCVGFIIKESQWKKLKKLVEKLELTEKKKKVVKKVSRKKK